MIETKLVVHMHGTDHGVICPLDEKFYMRAHFLDKGCPAPKEQHSPALLVTTVYRLEAPSEDR